MPVMPALGKLRQDGKVMLATSLRPTPATQQDISSKQTKIKLKKEYILDLPILWRKRRSLTFFIGSKVCPVTKTSRTENPENGGYKLKATVKDQTSTDMAQTRGKGKF